MRNRVNQRTGVGDCRNTRNLHGFTLSRKEVKARYTMAPGVTGFPSEIFGILNIFLLFTN